MNNQKKDKNNYIFKYLLLIEIAFLGFIIFDTYGKYYLSKIGFFRFFVKRVNPETQYYKYTQGIWSMIILPLTVFHFSLTMYYRKRYQNPMLNRAFFISIITIVLQILVVIISLYNNGLLGG